MFASVPGNNTEADGIPPASVFLLDRSNLKQERTSSMSLRLFRGDQVDSQNVGQSLRKESSGGLESDAKYSDARYSDARYLGQYIPLHYHYNMLQDEHRVNAFQRAIQATVRPGMHVVELGGGTGILSSFAARQGANVSCVERNPELVDCAARLIHANGLSSHVRVIQGDACDYIPDAPVDVVICEMLHVGLLREKQLQVINAFKKNYGREIGGALPRFLPEASLLTFQAIDHPFDFAGYYAPIPLFQSPQPEANNTCQLSSLIRYGSVIYDQAYTESCGWSGLIPIEQSGSVSALRFITQNVIAISEGDQSVIEWPNQFLVLPLESTLDVRAGESVQIDFQYQAGDSLDILSRSMQVRSSSQHNRSLTKARCA
jgi:protein arginine N-methyltransferase 1